MQKGRQGMKYGKLLTFILSLFISLTGCLSATLPTTPTWKNIDDLENEASKYGTIAVGAPRITNYDNPELQESRKRLICAIKAIQSEFSQSSPQPEASIEHLTETNIYFRLAIEPSFLKAFEGWINSPAAAKPDSAKLIEEFKKYFDEKIAELKNLQGNKLAPNRIDMATLRLSALRFLESKLEDLNLTASNPVGEDYNRFQVSVSLTIWTREPATAALVYLDIYPFDGDLWCHKAINEKGKDELSKRGDEFKRTFGNESKFSKEDIIKEIMEWQEVKDDPYGKCHLWLLKNNLVPKLVYVESLGDSRYLLDSESVTTGYDTNLSIGIKKLGIGTGQSGSEAAHKSKAEIKVISLSFAAGERRAGWFFMREGDNEMRPVEYRVRMIVDIPKSLGKVDIHVHKTFIGKNGEIVSYFSEQTENLHKARKTLDAIENEADDRNLYPNYTYWQLVKSRVRNLLSLGWSERIVIDIPKVEKQDKGAKP
jgi:hypothetical protein